MLEKLQTLGWQLITILAIGVIAFWVASTMRTTYGSAPTGLQVGTSTIEQTIPIGGGIVTLFSASNNCASRVVTAASSSLRVTFGSSTPTTTHGYHVATGTSATFDSGIYGCQQWQTTIEAGGASGTASVVEFR